LCSSRLKKEKQNEACSALADLFTNLPDKTKAIVEHFGKHLKENKSLQERTEMVTWDTFIDKLMTGVTVATSIRMRWAVNW